MLRSVLLLQRPDQAGELAILPVGPVPGHSLPNYMGLNVYVHTCVHECVGVHFDIFPPITFKKATCPSRFPCSHLRNESIGLDQSLSKNNQGMSGFPTSFQVVLRFKTMFVMTRKHYFPFHSHTLTSVLWNFP